jgi:tRNA U34 5-methylaminomethyl-2-thiouridine-forming methyltransferase MnmC
MQQNLIVTEDGSHSVSVPGLNVTYHSTHGAIQESHHIFIDGGLKEILKTRKDISIFEMGFGTGLNALLSLYEVHDRQYNIYYETVEQYPLEQSVAASLNYITVLNTPHLQAQFELMHSASWNKIVSIEKNFSFCKRKENIEDAVLSNLFHLIYFDAFAPLVQPHLWATGVFKKLYNAMHPGGLLLTYCSKAVVRKAMQEAGFIVEKLPGPIGKREIVRAIKKGFVALPQH